MQGMIRTAAIFHFALLLRWCITYHSYSGQGKPPMFGDYEAQRHWQEITLNLPIDKWYTNSTDNDLQYWGLDYPPLTAYHSLALGHIAKIINSSYVELHTSRGISTSEHKYFMRLTVLSVDALIYIPAMIYFIMNLPISGNLQASKWNIFGFKYHDIILITALIYPGLILIDHGHFQYNCVSLGLFVGAVALICRDSFISGSILFVLALNYKQMELYHSLPFFFYTLGMHTPSANKSWYSCMYTLICISLAVSLTFFIVWAPFLKNPHTFASVVIRLFPLSRGVFEDKVANIWCVINVFLKVRNVFTNLQLAHICLVITTIAALPSSINIFLTPTKEKFVLSLINSALAFFLCSFQVHEKSILLVAIPVLLHFHNDTLACFWFLLTSHFSMLPLFIKDDLYSAYMSLAVFYFCAASWMWLDAFTCNKNKIKDDLNIKHNSLHCIVEENYIFSLFDKIKPSSTCVLTVFYMSVTGMLFLSIVSYFLKPPERYPDLFSLLVSIYSCAHFFSFYLYFNYKQLSILEEVITKKDE